MLLLFRSQRCCHHHIWPRLEMIISVGGLLTVLARMEKLCFQTDCAVLSRSCLPREQPISLEARVDCVVGRSDSGRDKRQPAGRVHALGENSAPRREIPPVNAHLDLGRTAARFQQVGMETRGDPCFVIAALFTRASMSKLPPFPLCIRMAFTSVQKTLILVSKHVSVEWV